MEQLPCIEALLLYIFDLRASDVFLLVFQFDSIFPVFFGYISSIRGF